ncbi:type II secretion system protein [Neobacillus vireti]|uniref:type II secretion system protein n=1 Tax=Neobacillus vireti TaxID=220686 RepID=UPI002FFEE2B6
MLKVLKLKEQKGFTLIELLAVIVILGILAAIAVPAIGNIIEKSKTDAQITEAIQIIDAAKLAYAEDNTTKTFSATSTDNDVTAATNDLEDYISKLKDKSWTVTLGANNVWTITNHEVDTAGITEDELSALARN